MILGAGLVLCVALLFCLGGILPLHHALALSATVVWFTLPGVLIARTVYAKQPGASIGSWLLGGVLGHAFSSLALLALWVGGVRTGWILALAPLVACSVAFLVRPLAGRFALPQFTRADVLAVLLLLLIVPFVVGRPFARVGADLPEGRAYRAYFTADFIWRMAVAAELSKGDVPPRNQFYLDDPLRYYWLPHLLPAIQYREQLPRARLEQILLVNSVILDLVFVAFLYGLCRQLVSSPMAAALGCVGAVLFTSFEGAERVWFLWKHGQSFDRLRYINIDAVENWFYGALKIDGLQRLLWYQPHHAMGYAVGLIGLLNATQTRDVGRFSTMVWIGSLLACALLLSTFAALMLVTMTALYVAIRLLTERRAAALLRAAIGGAIPLGIGFAIATWLQYVDRGETLIQLGLNRSATRGVVAALLLNLPMVGTGMAGLWLAMRRNQPYVDIFGVIVGVSVLYYFFVDVRDHQHVYVGFRFGHFMFIACAALTGYALQEIRRTARPLKLAASTLLVVIAVAAVPTAAIDIYNTQDTANRALGPGFQWTLVLTPDELAGLDWIRRSTPTNAIVQIEPSIHDSSRAQEAGGAAGTWAYVPAFAERRMAGGIPIGMVPLDKYLAASKRVKEIYEAGDWRTAYERAKALRIDYLMVGPPERSAYPALEPMLVAQPTFFQPVFHNGSVSIFRLAR